jgi:hypothetical protein
MPPELVDYEPTDPEGMPDVTISDAYNEVWVALESGMSVAEFRLLPYENQAELMAYHYVNNRIKRFFQEHQEEIHKSRMAAMKSDAARSFNR